MLFFYQGFAGHSNYPMFPDGFEQEMMFHAHNQNLSHHKVPESCKSLWI
jgi:hypothetical protein